MELQTSDYIDDRELEERTPNARSTWQKRRISGDTPPWYRIGGRVYYKWSEVQAWIEDKQNRRRSTSDMTGAPHQ